MIADNSKSIDFIWITGPAAAGKTVIVSKLSRLIPDCFVFTDAIEMLCLNELDENHKYHIYPTGEEGFLLTSTYHFDESVKRIVSKLSQTKIGQKAVIEVARGIGTNLDIDVSYKRFRKLVPLHIFKRSLVIYVKTEQKIRFIRNIERRRSNYFSNIENDSFYVPGNAMKQFFSEDDFEQEKDLFNCPVYIIDNNRQDISSLNDTIGTLLKKKLNIAEGSWDQKVYN